MKASNWAILGAVAGLAGIAINKQLRLARHRLSPQAGAGSQPGTEGRASIDDVPTVQPQEVPRSADDTMRFDETVAPGAPL